MLSRYGAVVATAAITASLNACTAAQQADCTHPNRAVIAWADETQGHIGVFTPDGSTTEDVVASINRVGEHRYQAHMSLPGKLLQVCEAIERYHHTTTPMPYNDHGSNDYVIGLEDVIAVYGVGDGKPGPDRPWAPEKLGIPT